jgi:GntR family transcriptional regulator, rspAB operon transcriptional repressor
MQDNTPDASSRPTFEREGPSAQTDVALAARGLPFTAPKPLEGGGVKTSLVQLVYEAILAELDDGKLRPGQRIVASAVASRLKLSRAPVREALHVLAGRGLVELQPDRGALLRKLYREDLAELYELAGPVVAIGVRAAAERINEGDNAKRIQAAIDRVRRSTEIKPRFRFYLVLNDFHYVANDIGRKPWVDFVMRSINIEYWNRMLAEAIDLDVHVPAYIRNYERLADSILAGDGRAAEAIVIGHCQWAATLCAPPGP